MNPDLDRRFGVVLHDVARLLRKRFDRRAQHLGLTRAQWTVVAHLYRRQGVNQTTLADWLDVEKITVARLVDRLEAAGWVERRPDPQDRRAKCLFLTDKVYPMLAEMRAVADEVQAEALRGLEPAEQERMIEMLLTVKANLLSLEYPAPAEADRADDPMSLENPLHPA